MRNAVIITLAGIFLVSLITLGIAYAMPVDSPESPPISNTSSLIPTPEEMPYLLRTYQGKLAIFTEDLVNPDMVFEVYVRTLPEYDQAQLERGIRAATFEDLTKLVEDYIS